MRFGSVYLAFGRLGFIAFMLESDVQNKSKCVATCEI